jgi:mono/diheme cytochrome c family protein
MMQHLNCVSRLLSSFYLSVLATNLLVIALSIMALSSLGCANQPAGNTTVNAPTASPTTMAPGTPANTTVTSPTQVTEKTKNPLPDPVTAASLGKPLYQANCALCHGDFGVSDGPASSSYDPKPTDLTKGEVTTDPDGEMFLVIKNGKGKMPGMKRLTDEQIWQVVAYVRTLAKK